MEVLLGEMTPLASVELESGIGMEVLSGLSAVPKTLSAWLFYDEEGSRLFERITELPEYYLTRTERGILERHAAEIIEAAAGNDAGQIERLSVIELGAGTAAKTGLLLSALVERQGTAVYVPLDVSPTALDEAQRHLEAELPGVTVQPQVMDYSSSMHELPKTEEGRRLALYIGSSIGNFEPRDALSVLEDLRANLSKGDCLLLGVDMVKDERVLLDAYDDAEGVTAMFNKNVLVRINRELGGDFPLDQFDHLAAWNATESRIEMHLVSTRPQTVCIPQIALEAHFDAGETIHTENSYKYTPEGVDGLLDSAGFTPVQHWMDAQGWFRVSLARVE